MKILIACEESQTVCAEMRRLGHEAYSADIQKPSGGHLEWHILGDVLPLINGKCRFTTMYGMPYQITGKWDLLIAHLPCTYLTSAGACRLMPKGKLDKSRLEQMAYNLCKKFGLLSPMYKFGKRGGCWFFSNDFVKEHAHTKAEYPELWEKLRRLSFCDTPYFRYDETFNEIDRAVDDYLGRRKL